MAHWNFKFIGNKGENAQNLGLPSYNTDLYPSPSYELDLTQYNQTESMVIVNQSPNTNTRIHSKLV